MAEAVTFTAHHFRDDLSGEEARDLFRRSVRYVEIELTTYCNRKCHFCPNKDLPFRQDRAGNQFMDSKLYVRILDDLASVGYCGSIQFGRYNEPLAGPGFRCSVGIARETLPKAYLYSHTNGDFVSQGYLDDLREAGLNELQIQTYLGNGQRWDETAMRNRMSQQLRRLGLGVRRVVTDAPGRRHYVETDYPGMLVSLDARNFDEIGTDRGGLVQIQQHRPRVAPCLIPFSQMYIDWNGSVMPCCNLRSDVAEHQKYIVANLNECSIFDAYVALCSWRKSLLRFGEKKSPCATCRYDEDAVPESAANELERVYQLSCEA